ncbi:hypothetical protein DITRI_Ditri01bG0048400 [Diplodiscus trichospermus]
MGDAEEKRKLFDPQEDAKRDDCRIASNGLCSFSLLQLLNMCFSLRVSDFHLIFYLENV